MLVAVALVAATAARARADELDPQIDQLAHGESYKVRLAAAINLSKSREAKAVAALATALIKDEEPTIRRVAALALGKIVDETTPSSTRALAMRALAQAAKSDRDAKVREAAQKAKDALDALANEPSGNGPAVFVNVGGAVDTTHKGPPDLEKRLAGVVRGVVKHSSYAVEWPGGGSPTHNDLSRAGTKAYFVGATVAEIKISTKGNKTTIDCTVAIRIAPWDGSDGNERWEATKAATAKGSGMAETGTSDTLVAGGIRDCVLAVAEEVAQRKVIPFIKNLSASK
ncbi:MAG TPA: HEAT repeat domain-containing protein [Kofleriaceae bacterium]|nr:HEAT repeat domain-containing protein [Kofleriaceae bacterium]